MKVKRSIKAPVSFNRRFDYKNSKVELFWQAEDLKELKLRGYRIEVRHSSEPEGEYKEVIAHRKLCKANKYTYKVPVEYKNGSYLHFRCYAVDFDNNDGLHAECKVQLHD